MADEKIPSPIWERTTCGKRSPKLPYCHADCRHYWMRKGRCQAADGLPTLPGQLCEPEIADFFSRFRDFMTFIASEIYEDTY